jgi:hypothetical protein
MGLLAEPPSRALGVLAWVPGVRRPARWEAGGPALDARRVGVAGLGMVGIWRRLRYGVGLGAAEGVASGALPVRGLDCCGRFEGVVLSMAGPSSPSECAWLAMVGGEEGRICVFIGLGLDHWGYSIRTWFSRPRQMDRALVECVDGG